MATEQDCLAALREAADRLGESPTKAQYEELGLTPSASTILRHCGGWNDAKEQAGLETNPSTGSRVQAKPDDVELPDGMEWAELSQDQRWHYKNREHNTQRSLQRRERHRAWIYEIKQERGCRQCGESDAACLDLHHRADTEKRRKISMMITFGYGKDKLREEVDKCEVLCANCHWTEHNTEVKGMNSVATTVDPSEPLENRSIETVATQLSTAELPLTKEERLRAWTHAYKRARGCLHCGEQSPICLQFHHDNDDKTLGVGQLISRSHPVEAVLTEVEKCLVLCANCHRKEHYEPPSAAGTTDE